MEKNELLLKKLLKMSVKHILSSLIFILVVPLFVKAQMSSLQFEYLSARLLYEKKWDSLKLISHQRIKQGEDYYYLRYRLGVAYYESHDYRTAATHLEKAYTFNNGDHYLLEYLYYSYLFGGRECDAQWIAAELPKYLKLKTSTKENKWIRSIYAEGGTSLSNNFNKNQDVDINDTSNIFGTTDLNNRILYGHIGLSHQLGRFLNVYQGFSYINIDKKKLIAYPGRDTVFPYKLNQTEYYVNLDFVPIKSWKITPFFHGQLVKSTSIDAIYDSVTNTYSTFPDETSLSQIIVGATLQKEWQKFCFGAFFSFSNINYAKQRQLGVTVTWFPKGNTDLYTYTAITWLNEYKQPTDSKLEKNRFIIDQNIGKKIYTKLWVEIGATLGDLTHYNEKNGFVVYNSSDKINYRVSASFIIPLTKQIELSLRYQYLGKETDMNYYQTISKQQTKTLNYQNNNILGGIKWKL